MTHARKPSIDDSDNFRKMLAEQFDAPADLPPSADLIGEHAKAADPRTNWPSPTFTYDPADPTSAYVVYFGTPEGVYRFEPAEGFDEWTPMRDKKVCDICEGHLASGTTPERLPHTECWEAWVITHD